MAPRGQVRSDLSDDACVKLTTLAVVLAAAAALVSGCQSASEVAAPTPPNPCPGGAVSPIQIDDLIRVFRQHGLTMFNDPACASSTSERQASNEPIYGPGAQTGDHDAITASQGSVYCLLDKTAVRPLLPVTENKYPTDQETSFDAGNVTCLIYPESDETENEQLERLRAAMNALAREVAPPKLRVESDIEERLGPLTSAECAGEDDRWLCDVSDVATEREHGRCEVRLNDAGRIISAVERCRPE
jgi:hypothetical protein